MQWSCPLLNKGLFSIYLALLIMPLATVARGAETSYQCAAASGQVEQLICTDENLAALDQRLARVYTVAVQNSPPGEQANLKVEQRGWIKGRNDCWKAEDVTSCVEESYRTRTVELQIRSGQLSAPAAVGYSCEGHEQAPFFATFYADTKPASVVLTKGDDQVIAFITRSASGARYNAAGVEFWEHQGEAMVNWYGTDLQCRLIPAQGQSRGID